MASCQWKPQQIPAGPEVGHTPSLGHWVPHQSSFLASRPSYRTARTDYRAPTKVAGPTASYPLEGFRAQHAHVYKTVEADQTGAWFCRQRMLGETGDESDRSKFVSSTRLAGSIGGAPCWGAATVGAPKPISTFMNPHPAFTTRPVDKHPHYPDQTSGLSYPLRAMESPFYQFEKETLYEGQHADIEEGWFGRDIYEASRKDGQPWINPLDASAQGWPKAAHPGNAARTLAEHKYFAQRSNFQQRKQPAGISWPPAHSTSVNDTQTAKTRVYDYQAIPVVEASLEYSWPEELPDVYKGGVWKLRQEFPIGSKPMPMSIADLDSSRFCDLDSARHSYC